MFQVVFRGLQWSTDGYSGLEGVWSGLQGVYGGLEGFTGVLRGGLCFKGVRCV